MHIYIYVCMHIARCFMKPVEAASPFLFGCYHFLKLTADRLISIEYQPCLQLEAPGNADEIVFGWYLVK